MYAIIDNYDSFTHNLRQLLGQITTEPVRVVRNDKITVDELLRMQPTGIIISPGPGRPEEAGISLEAVRRFAGTVPILGVCLGHQVIGQAFGGEIVSAQRVVHGKVEEMRLDGKGLFRNLPPLARFTRYHSLAISRTSLPADLEVTASSSDGEIMGVRHRIYPVEGIQFHPESIASECGLRLLRNFVHYRREPFPYTRLLSRLQARVPITAEEAEAFMDELTEGELSDARIAAVLATLAGELITAEALVGLARVLRRKKTPFPNGDGRTGGVPALDTCGTGGDGLGTFNISSLVAVVAASCGARVAKHGNRGVSSPSGSADFFKALGVPTDLSPASSARLLDQTGFCFLFAPLYHGAMKHAAQARRELGVKSVMNLIGPLANPADAAFQLIGVFDGTTAPAMAKAARLLGVRRAMVIHGEDGEDELSVCSPSQIVEVAEQGEPRQYTVRPEDFGLSRFSVSELKGGSAAENSALAMEILAGTGPRALREAVVFNSGAALAVCGRAGSIAEGCAKARRALEEGAAMAKLRQIRAEAARLQTIDAEAARGTGAGVAAGSSAGGTPRPGGAR